MVLRKPTRKILSGLGAIVLVMVAASQIGVVHGASVAPSLRFRQAVPTLDPDVRAVVEAAARQVARQVQPPAPVAPTPAISTTVTQTMLAELIPITPTAVISATPTAPAQPAPAAPAQATPTLEVAQSTAPGADIGNLAVKQYTNEGITIQAPADWQVNPGSLDMVFNMRLPGTQFVGTVQGTGQTIFPGILAVLIFRDQAATVVREIDPDAEITGVETLSTDQELPLVKVAFNAQFEGAPASGAFYVTSPGGVAYMLIMLAPAATWSELEAGAGLIAQSIFFDPAAITLTKAETGDLVYTDPRGGLRFTVPQNWQVATTADATFSLLLLDPQVQLVGALGTDVGNLDKAGLSTDALRAVAARPLDDAAIAQLSNALLGALALSPGDLIVAREQVAVLPVDGGAVIRLAGMANLGEFQLPIVYYLGAQNDARAEMIFFGDTTQILAQEPTIVQIVTSLRRSQ